jgi:diguanylate cyclase (GGDEF)-like protein
MRPISIENEENISMKTIFVVDDNHTNLLTVKNALEGTYRTITMPSAARMFQLVEKIMPDLILLDINMPETDGFEAIKILKADEQLAEIPVIFLTAKTETKSEVEGFELGAVDYIVKPFSAPIIKARIATHLKLIEQKRIIEQLSLIDALTRIPNRRHFDNELLKQWKLAGRTRSAISILMIDVDYFKKFNDTYGHLQGDAALQSLAHLISISVRQTTDFVARWGGEEFAVILPATNSEGALVIAEKIRKAVEKNAIPEINDSGNELFITVSIGGFSIKPSNSVLIEDFIKKADEALYTAKTNGRNRVCIL